MGIREKLRDANHLRKFHSVVSELEIARLLIRHDKIVEFLPDDYFYPGKSPDIQTSDEKWVFFVEVKKFTEDDAVNKMIADIENFLSTSTRNCRVNLMLKQGLSMVTIEFRERKTKEKLATKSVQDFKDKFRQADLSNLPISIDTEGCNFEINESGLNRSYVGITKTGIIDVPIRKVVEKIRYDVIEKAQKRIYWKTNHPSIFYMVAIDCDQPFVDSDDIELALIGDRITIAESPVPIEIALPTKLARGVKKASKKGWEAFLKEQYIIPRDRTFLDISKKGIYFTKRVAKNVSGVLARFRVGDFHWIPNPFAYDEINDPNLVDYFQL